MLFAASDGGHERDVLSGTPVIADESIPVHIFSFRFQRAVRGEDPIVTLEPAFRLTSPTTVITYELPRTFGHLLVKRAGPADDIPDALVDPPRSLVGIAREASGIDRVVPVAAPASLPARAIALEALDGSYHLWAASPEQARVVFSPETGRYLRSAAAGTGEWIVELLGSMMIVYCATDGALSEDQILAMTEFSDELCRRILRATSPASPRGMEHRP